MPKDEWGVKRLCPTSGKRFYDLNKNPVVSPYTGEVVDIDTGKASRSLTADKPDKANPKTAKEDEALVDDAEELLDDDAENIDVDDDLLDDDDNDTVALDDLADVPANDGDDDS